MSLTRGGTAAKPWSSGGRVDGSAGSAGISITFRTAQSPVSRSRYHIQTELDRSARLSTTPTKPYARRGLCAGRSSSTICCSAPSSSFFTCERFFRSHTWSALPYFPARSSSGFTPSRTMFGVPHSLVIIVSWPRCHQTMVPFEEGRQLAARIPDVRFVPLDSQNHVLLEHEPAWARFLEEVRAFLGVSEERREGHESRRNGQRGSVRVRHERTHARAAHRARQGRA